MNGYMKKAILVFLCAACCPQLYGGGTETGANLGVLSPQPDKDTIYRQPRKFPVQIAVGGRVDVLAFYDTYASQTTRGGIHYYFPLAPLEGSAGVDVNEHGTMGFGVASSRLNAKFTAPDIFNAKTTAYFEVDFMGNSDNNINTIRVRHAWFNFAWVRSNLRLGQSYLMSVAEDISPDVVSFGGGSPFNPISRPIQIVYTYKLNDLFDVSASSSMGLSPRQGTSNVPEFQGRVRIDNKKNLIAGVVMGYMSVRPRTMTDDTLKAHSRVTAASLSVFGRYTFPSGYKLSAYSIWGENLSTMDMTGGYAKQLDDHSEDYKYSPTRTWSGWLDMASPIIKRHWQWGVFAGFQKNLGATKPIDVNTAFIPWYGIDRLWRVAPRLYFIYNNVTFGFEYMYNRASWAKVMAPNYKPLELYPDTQDNRITFLARFNF